MTLWEAAEAYAGTSWKHLGRDRGGMDCAGLLWRAYADCGLVLPIPRRYGRDPFREGLRTALVAALGDPVWQGSKGTCRRDLMQPGDIVVMSPASKARHVAMIAPDEYYGLSLIHSDGNKDMRKVARLGLGDFYLNMIVEIYRRPIE